MNRRNLKNKKGITLVALIITIIVLLILAMVSISLVMNEGIITKSKSAVDKYSEEEIKELIGTAYSEYQMSKYSDSENQISFQDALDNAFGGENIAKASEEKNGKININVYQKVYQYIISTGTTREYVDPFNYGEGKTKTTVAAGDEISITKETTEYFTVISNTNGTIVAMPKYNITLTEDHPVQSPSAGTSTFSSSRYWSEGVEDIDMSNSKNNIQKYINAYKTTLEDMGAEEITVRAAKRSELSASGVTNAMRNPSHTGAFWVGSVYQTDWTYLSGVKSDGSLDANHDFNPVYSYGVRPVIVIS